MQHPFIALQGEYSHLLATMAVKVNLAGEIDAAARKLVDPRHFPIYSQDADRTTVPALLIAGLDERESGGNLSTGIGQGDPWNQVSRHVPAGKGPFRSKVEADTFYIQYDHLDVLQGSPTWTWPYVCWKGEAWNGFGPRAHNIHTGYLWAGTNHYDRGKYVADGVWDANHRDTQLGLIPVLQRLIELRPEWGVVGSWPMATDISAPTTPQPLPPPQGVGQHGDHDTMWLQHALNVLKVDGTPLLEDGSFGRRTRNVVRAFQRTHGLGVDGIAGPLTTAALDKLLPKA